MAVQKSCETCEFCMPANEDLVCAGGTPLPNGSDTYGMKIEETEKLFPHGCDNWEMSFRSFCEEENI